MLHNALRKAGRLRRPAKVENWTREFDRLLDSYPKDLVFRALKYYCQKLEEKSRSLPDVLSARGFLKHFKEVLRQMGTDASTASEEATCVAGAVLREGDWPGGCHSQMPAAVQESLDNYAPFYEGVKGLAEADLTGRAGRFARYLLQSRKISPPAQFLCRWFQTLGEQFKNWPAWSGDLSLLIFSPTSRQLQKLGRGWAQEWAGRPGLWDKFLEEVGGG